MFQQPVDNGLFNDMDTCNIWVVVLFVPRNKVFFPNVLTNAAKTAIKRIK